MAIQRVYALAAVLILIACGDRGSRNPSPDELGNVSPEIFSHGDPTLPDKERCAGQDGIVISGTSIGPVHLGRPLRSLRQSCDIALLKVPASVAIQVPVMGVLVGGGLIAFTVSGKDSVIETAGTSSPAFRTETGLGVGSGVAQVPARTPTLCFRRDSAQIVEVFISRKTLSCWMPAPKPTKSSKPHRRKKRQTHRRR